MERTRRPVGDPARSSTGVGPGGRGNRQDVDPEPDPDSVAHTICLRLLGVRARTRAELADALHRRNVPSDAADRVLDRLTAVGLIDDSSFAVDFVHARHTERGLSARELTRQLRQKGVQDHVIAAAVEVVDADAELQAARRLAQRKMRSMSALEPVAQSRRLAGLLARKGYSPGLTYRVVREVVGDGTGSEDGGPDLD